VNDFATITGRSALTFERYFPGPIERVWSFLTDSKKLPLWFCDGNVADHVVGDIDFGIGATGRITAYEPPHLLEYTWNEEEAAYGSVVDSLVRWELSEDGDRVRLILKHTRLPEIEVLPHGAGWHAFLQRLVSRIDGLEPEKMEELFPRLKSEYAPIAKSAGIDVYVS